jgi:WD40 repeat protein
LVAATADGRFLAVDLDSGNIRGAGSVAQRATGVAAVDEGRVVEAGPAGAYIYDFSTGEAVTAGTGATATDEIVRVRASGDGQVVVLGRDDGTVVIWDLPSGEQRAAVGHTAEVSALAVGGDGQVVVSAALDHLVVVWSVELRTERRPG